jgi:UDP-galactopyranose mutase
MPAEGYTRMFERMLEGIDVDLGMQLSPEDVDSAHIVWTGPIDEAFNCELGRLPWRSLEFEHVGLPSWDLVQPVGVLNYPSGQIGYTRTTEWRHLTGQGHDWTTITYEFPSAEGEPYYPVPAPEARALYKRYEALAAEQPNLTFVGRLARYQYLAMHQVIGQALKTARDLLT